MSDPKERLVRIMGTFDLATGHADTLDELLDSLESELRDVLGHYRTAREWVGLTDEQMLGNLLARIHRDGGHYQGTHGVKKACEDAEAKVVGWLSMEHEIESTKEKNT